VFENRVLRRIFGQKRDEVLGDLRELRNQELRNMYSSPSTIRRIITRRMTWIGHVACTRRGMLIRSAIQKFPKYINKNYYVLPESYSAPSPSKQPPWERTH
jgi:hypothetical protein